MKNICDTNKSDDNIFYYQKNKNFTKELTINYLVDFRIKDYPLKLNLLENIIRTKLEKDYSLELASLYDAKITLFSESINDKYLLTFKIDYIVAEEFKFDFEEKEVFSLLKKIIRNLTITPENLKREISNVKLSIESIRSKKNSVLKRELDDLLYFENSNYTKWSNLTSSLEEIKLEEINVLYQGIFTFPNYIFYSSKEKIDQTNFEEFISIEKLESGERQINNEYVEKFLNFDDNQVNFYVVYNVEIKVNQWKILIFNALFGGGSFSRLFTIVREKNQLCYSIGSSVQSKKLIIVNAGVAKENIKKSVTIIDDQIELLAEFCSEELLSDAKVSLLNHLSKKKNDFNFQKNIKKNNLLFQEEETVEEIEKIIKETTTKEMSEIAKSLIKTKFVCSSKGE